MTVLPPEPTPLFVMIVLNVKNPEGLGMKLDGTAAEAFDSLVKNYEQVTDMGLVNALCTLHTAVLSPSTLMSEHITRMCMLWSDANEMGAKIGDPTSRGIFILSLGAGWDNVVPVLHTYTKSADVINFVTMHVERLSRDVPAASTTTSTQALATNTYEARRAARRALTGTHGTIRNIVTWVTIVTADITAHHTSSRLITPSPPPLPVTGVLSNTLQSLLHARAVRLGRTTDAVSKVPPPHSSTSYDARPARRARHQRALGAANIYDA
ncbi:hypothetical protein B0H10DRAFT_2231049 [Mycena sp. CBHHK59/15]|nr:hypothetical protein B0H10DRAFT_2231049 [Mycena sp. CBHHK59/15]